MYAVAQEVLSTTFLQWHGCTGGGGTQIALLHLVSSYVPQVVMPPSYWDDISFVSKGEVTCGTITSANCLTAILRHIGTAAHVLMSQSIDVGK